MGAFFGVLAVACVFIPVARGLRRDHDEAAARLARAERRHKRLRREIALVAGRARRRRDVITVRPAAYFGSEGADDHLAG